MDHNMVLSYDYVATNKCTSFAGHLDGHAEALKQYMRHHPSMSRATPEATGRCHWATTHSVSPRRPPGGQQIKQKYVPTWMAVLMAIAITQLDSPMLVVLDISS